MDKQIQEMMFDIIISEYLSMECFKEIDNNINVKLKDYIFASLEHFTYVDKEKDSLVVKAYNDFFLRFLDVFVLTNKEDEKTPKIEEKIRSYNKMTLRLFDCSYRLMIYDENSFLSPIDNIYLGGLDLSFFEKYFLDIPSFQRFELNLEGFQMDEEYQSLGFLNDKLYKLLLQKAQFDDIVQKRTINADIIIKLVPSINERILRNLYKDKDEVFYLNLIKTIVTEVAKYSFKSLLVEKNILDDNLEEKYMKMSAILREYIEFYFEVSIRCFNKKYDNILKVINESELLNEVLEELTSNLDSKLSLSKKLEIARNQFDYAKRNKIKLEEEFMKYIIFYNELKNKNSNFKAIFNKTYKEIRELINDIEAYSLEIGISKDRLMELSKNEKEKNLCDKTYALKNIDVLIKMNFITKEDNKLKVLYS